MTAWTPRLRLTIDGTVYNQADIDSLFIQGGRPDPTVQPNAMTSTVSIRTDSPIGFAPSQTYTVHTDNPYKNFATSAASGTGTTATITTSTAHGLVIGDLVEITNIVPTGYQGTYTVLTVPSTTQFRIANTTTGVQTTAGNVQELEPLFNGLITDVTGSFNSWSNGNGLYQHSIMATSRLAWLASHRQQWAASGNAITSSGFAAYVRIVEVLSNWQYNPDWVGVIDTDAITLHKRSAGIYTDLEVIQSAANSSRGVFFDRGDGKVNYFNFANAGLTSFPAVIQPEQLIASGIRTTKSITDVSNAIHVTTTNASLSDAVTSNTSSINSIGYRYGERATECNTSTDMSTQATAFNSGRSVLRWRPETFTVDMSATTLSDYNRDLLLRLRTSSYVQLWGLPSAWGGDLDLLVDNWSWQFSRGRAELTIGASLYTDTHP